MSARLCARSRSHGAAAHSVRVVIVVCVRAWPGHFPFHDRGCNGAQFVPFSFTPRLIIIITWVKASAFNVPRIARGGGRRALHFTAMALLVFASLLLALPQPMAEPLPVPEKRPATGALPAGLLKGEGGAMHAWYCGQPGNEAALPCLVQQLRALPKGPERDALQLKIREAPKPNWGRGAEGKGGGGEGKGGGGAGAGLLGPQGRDVVSAMHEGWCALKENAESALCLKWRESAQRRYVAAEEHGQSGPLGSAPARLLRLLRARLAAHSSALPGRGPATGTPATAPGARASRLQSRRVHRL